MGLDRCLSFGYACVHFEPQKTFTALGYLDESILFGKYIGVSIVFRRSIGRSVKE